MRVSYLHSRRSISRVRTEPADLPEWMDEPCTYEEFRACLADLEQANRILLAYRPTLKFLEDATAQHDSSRPLSIVDVGCGAGDMLRRIARWAVQRQVKVELTGIDLNPYSRRYGHELDRLRKAEGASDIEWVTGDAFSYVPPAPVDIVLSSLFTHHLSTEEVVCFVAWMEATAQRGWFISDLLRSPRAYQFFGLLSRVARWHRFIQHDGPISICRAFRDDDWRRIAFAAGLLPSAFTLEHWNPGRLCVRRLK